MTHPAQDAHGLPDNPADTMKDALHGGWPLPYATHLRDELLKAWAGPSRGHHGLRHLADVLEAFALLRSAEPALSERGAQAAILAAWFHDAVYDGQPDAEARSAAWAGQALGAVAGSAPDVDVTEVVRLIMLTTSHSPAASDVAGYLLCDADLSILGSPPGRYQEYADGVRHEYQSVPATDYARARITILEGFLARTQIYTSTVARDRWESVARANLGAEIETLSRW